MFEGISYSHVVGWSPPLKLLMKMTTAKERVFRLHELKSVVEQAMKEGKVVLKEEFMAEMSVKWGLSRRYALEYLKTLERVKWIVVDGDNIYAPEYYDELKSLKNYEDDLIEDLQHEQLKLKDVRRNED